MQGGQGLVLGGEPGMVLVTSSNEGLPQLIRWVYAEDEDLNSNLIYSIHPNDEKQLQDLKTCKIL